MKLVTLGTVAFDAIETPFGKTDKIIGGAATYISLSASYLCKKPCLISVVGEDFPQDAIDMMNKHGINTGGLEISPGEKTFFWSGRYHNDMNTRDTLATELNVLLSFDPKVPENYLDAEYLMLGNLDPVIQKKILRAFPKRPRLVAMDTMNFWMDTAMDALLETISLVDVLTINDEEARQLSGEYSMLTAARKIMAMGPKYLIIKKGEHGALLFNQDGDAFFAPALPLENVFDPTGAGDSFAGGFMGYLAGCDKTDFEAMKRAVIYGSAMASFTVEAFGTDRLQNLNKSEINDRLDRFVSLTQFEISTPPSA